MFASHSQAKKFQVRFQLTNMLRGENFILEYFSKVRLLADTLATTENPFSDKEIVNYLLNGLRPLYESFVTSITTIVELVTTQELYHLLLIHESCIIHTYQNHNPSSFQPSTRQPLPLDQPAKSITSKVTNPSMPLSH